jgi:hypothetical protein
LTTSPSLTKAPQRQARTPVKHSVLFPSLALQFRTKHFCFAGRIMDKVNLPVYVFSVHIEAEDAVKALRKSDYGIKKLSIIGNSYQNEEAPIGFYTIDDRIKNWGGIGAGDGVKKMICACLTS